MPNASFVTLPRSVKVAAGDLADDGQELGHRSLQGFLRCLVARGALQSFGDAVQAFGERAAVFEARIELARGNSLREQFDIAAGSTHVA